MAIPAALRKEVHLLPSILSADFSRLGDEVNSVMDAGARIIHVDVMDGHFVPNITVGPLVLRALASEVHGRGGYFSVHLMIEHPEDFIEAFVKAGADGVAIHAEACAHVHHALEEIRRLGASPGVAMNPGSDVGRVEELKDMVDHVVVMTVNPGFGGQELIEPALRNIPTLKRMLPDDVAVEVDGGVKLDNVQRVVETGGNWVIAGSAVFTSSDPGAEVRSFQRQMAGSGGI